MHASACYSGFTTALPKPKPTLTFPTARDYYSPFDGSKPANYPTRTGSGPVRLSVKASSSSTGDGDGGGGFYAMAKMSFYELLGVAETGTEVEVKRAYKKLARKYHPDVSPPGRAEEYTRKFLVVKEAYETLSDPVKRALYDREMAMGEFHFAFSPRRHYHHDNDQVKERRYEWKSRWESQLSELMRRSNCKEHGGGDASWAARVRNQKDELVSK